MKIVTDCAADMPDSELKNYDITQAPLLIQFPEGEVNSADIQPDDFYDRLEAMRPAIPTTAQPSSGTFAEIYQRLLRERQQIFSLHISSGLSGTIDAARLGSDQASKPDDVTIWDTMSLSGGQRFQVLAAALSSKAGWSKDAILQRLTQIRSQTEVVYTLDTLEYLARGGRIGRVQALAGALLNLKPVIHVDHIDGKYSTVTRVRTLSRAMAAIVDHLQDVHNSTPLWITVLHGRFADKAADLSGELKERLNAAKVEILRISPVLGVHTGPGIVGAAVVPMYLMEDLL